MLSHYILEQWPNFNKEQASTFENFSLNYNNLGPKKEEKQEQTIYLYKGIDKNGYLLLQTKKKTTIPKKLNSVSITHFDGCIKLLITNY